MLFNMESFTSSKFLLLPLFFLGIAIPSFTTAQRNTFASPGSLLKCADFQDLRKIKDNVTSIYLPLNRTSQGIYSKEASYERTKFYLHTEETLKCTGQQVEERIMLWDYKSSSGNENNGVYGPRNFQSVQNGTSDPLQRAYFTSMGYFYDDTTRALYKPNGEYCIKSLSHDRITIDVCVLKDDCSKAPWPGTYCLPKCCAADEVLSMPSKTCVPVMELYQPLLTAGQAHNLDAGVTPWLPPVYTGSNVKDRMTPNVINVVQYWRDAPTESEFATTNITFKMAKLPKNCNWVPVAGKGASQQQQPAFKWWSAEGVGKEPKTTFNSQINETVRLVVPSGGKSGLVRPMLYNAKSKTWEVQSMADFCVDSVAGTFIEDQGAHEYHYTGNDHNFAVIFCDTPPVVTRTTGKSGGESRFRAAESILTIITIFVYIVLY